MWDGGGMVEKRNIYTNTRERGSKNLATIIRTRVWRSTQSNGITYKHTQIKKKQWYCFACLNKVTFIWVKTLSWFSLWRLICHSMYSIHRVLVLQALNFTLGFMSCVWYCCRWCFRFFFPLLPCYHGILAFLSLLSFATLCFCWFFFSSSICFSKLENFVALSFAFVSLSGS